MKRIELATEIAEVHRILASINAAWRSGQPLMMLQYLHPDIVMALPGFNGTLHGREALVDSFEEFCGNATLIEYEESDEKITVVGDCAAASFRFRMIYKRADYREESRGRDLWIFQRQDSRWIAVWRTMLDLTGERTSAESPKGTAE